MRVRRSSPNSALMMVVVVVGEVHKGFLERMGFKAQSYIRGSHRMWSGGGWNVIAYYKPCRSFCKCCSSLFPSKQGELRSSWGRDKGDHLFSDPPSKIMESLSVTKGRLSLLHTLTIPQQTLHPAQPMEFFLLVLPPLWPELGWICEVNTKPPGQSNAAEIQQKDVKQTRPFLPFQI